MMIAKTGKKKYYCAKYVAVFLSGGSCNGSSADF